VTTNSVDAPADRRLGIVILCGGQSRRMGQSKAWLRFGNETLLQRVVRRLLDVKEPLVVVRAPEQTLPDLPTQVQIVADTRADRGPLQGLESGLEALQDQVDRVFVSSTDAPFVDRTLIALLESRRDHADDVVVPRAFERLHPLAALYAVRVLPEIKKMLAKDQLRLMDLLGRVRTQVVHEDALLRIDPRLRCLMNVNTPEAHRLALAEDIEE
jgi:molybdenum cofactor guanylyltransferase